METVYLLSYRYSTWSIHQWNTFAAFSTEEKAKRYVVSQTDYQIEWRAALGGELVGIHATATDRLGEPQFWNIMPVVVDKHVKEAKHD